MNQGIENRDYTKGNPDPIWEHQLYVEGKANWNVKWLILTVSEVNLKSYRTHFLYCPAQISWLDFTALYRPLRCKFSKCTLLI